MTFEGFPAVVAKVVSKKPVQDDWAALFDPAMTEVDTWTYHDLSTFTLHSFDVASVSDFVQEMYTAVALADPTIYPKAQLLWEYLPRPDRGNITPTSWDDVKQALSYHQLPSGLPSDTAFDPGYSPPIPLFDFHQSLSALHSYPALMRRLGLVFDLQVKVPAGLTSTPNVKVAPVWHPKLIAGTLDVSPYTACHLSGSEFRALPRGPDYGNGMLDLQDSARYSVVGLDTDGIADRLNLLALTLLQSDVGPDSRDFGVPAMRTAGPQIIRTGWGEQPSKGPGLDLQNLLDVQKSNNSLVSAYIAAHGTGPLPVLNAEDLIRGHRVDVLTETETTPTWQSLCWREGTYVLGPQGSQITLSILDEGSVSPGVSQPSGLAKDGGLGPSVPPPPDLYVHERLVRWKGWSIVAPRPGMSGVGSGTDLQPGGANPVPPGTSSITPPQLSVTVTAPTSGGNLLPKLRFGELYRFRARGSDLAGNGPPASSHDSSTASAEGAHVRWEPVQSPQLAPIAPPVPGEGTELVVILNYMTTPATTPTPNGRWVFPPKVSEIFCEEHGMLDGFVEGSLPDPTKPPSGAAATYAMLATRDPLRLNDISGVEFFGSNPDSTGTPGVGSPYLPGFTKMSVPWLPDPLSAGVCLLGVPGGTGFVTRFWAGGPWPDPEPMYLELAGGTTAGESYTAATSSSSAIETITLPPGKTIIMTYSSALFPGVVGPKGRLLGLYILGMWQWIAKAKLTAKQLKELELSANAGLLWQLSPAPRSRWSTPSAYRSSRRPSSRRPRRGRSGRRRRSSSIRVSKWISKARQAWTSSRPGPTPSTT